MKENIIKNTVKDVYLYFKTPKIFNPATPKNVKKMLFVCKGNICRSPFAQSIANKLSLEHSLGKVVSFSAGLQVPVSQKSPHEVLESAKKFGVLLDDHTSCGITSDLAETSDMIIAMESWHVMRLKEMYPMHSDKIFLLPLFERKSHKWKWSYERNNILDPYGKPLHYFQKCFCRIVGCIDELFLII
jgi:protein-tyrosine phosphatase